MRRSVVALALGVRWLQHRFRAGEDSRWSVGVPRAQTAVNTPHSSPDRSGVRPGWQPIQRAVLLRRGPSGQRADTNKGCYPGHLQSYAAPRESTKRCCHFRIAGRGYGRHPNHWPEPVQLLGADHRSVNSWFLFYCQTGAAARLATGLHDRKFWPQVSHVDNVFGDRNPVCSCAGMENYG